MSDSSTHILVTGGAGYIGSHVAKALAAHGMVPVAFDSLVRGHQEAVKWGPFVLATLAMPVCCANNSPVPGRSHRAPRCVRLRGRIDRTTGPIF